MFKHDNFRVDFNTADYSDLTFSPKDREVLRRLAGEIAEIAARPVMDERRKLWFAHNALGKTRPLILCDPENGWNEIITDDQIECTNSVARHWECFLRKQLFWGNRMDDDYVVEAKLFMPYVFQSTPWRVAGSDKVVTMHSTDLTGGAYHIDPVLDDYAQLKDLVKAELIVDYPTQAGGSVEHWNEEPGYLWIKRFMEKYKKLIWINPYPKDTWNYTASTNIMRELVEDHMYPLTLSGLEEGMRFLSK